MDSSEILSRRTTQTYLDADRRSVWHPYTPLAWPHTRSIFTRAEGAYVFDNEGRRYFDSTSSWWCNLHGHCHPRLVAALSNQAATLDQILFAPHAHPKAIELAEALLEKLGFDGGKVFYSDNGSTAVEVAMKMALQYWQLRGKPERARFVSLERGYHGDTFGAMAVSHVGDFQKGFGEGVLFSHRAVPPYCYRCELGLQYPSCQIQCLRGVEETIARDGHQIAALIVEPLVMGVAGMVVYPPEYLDRLVALCREKETLVIFDEVFTGFGRTGTFFAYDQLKPESTPDLVCLSKGVTSGMLPLGVTGVGARVVDVFENNNTTTFYHGHTFTANAITCAVALESLKIFDDENVLERNRELIACFRAATTKFLSLPHVGDVRHLGMIWAVELVVDKNTQLPPSPLNGPGWKIADALWKKQIWLRPLHNIVYLVPPYCTTPSQLNEALSLLYSEVSNEEHFSTT